MHQNLKSTESGFTLIELLVVVSIVSILSSIGMSSYGEYRERAMIAAAHTLEHAAIVDFNNYIMTDTYNNNRAAERRWDKGAATPYASFHADELLPTMRVMEGYKVFANTSPFCNDEPEEHFSVYIVPYKAEKMTVYTKNCDGDEIKDYYNKNVNSWWF